MPGEKNWLLFETLNKSQNSLETLYRCVYNFHYHPGFWSQMLNFSKNVVTNDQKKSYRYLIFLWIFWETIFPHNKFDLLSHSCIQTERAVTDLQTALNMVTHNSWIFCSSWTDRFLQKKHWFMEQKQSTETLKYWMCWSVTCIFECRHVDILERISNLNQIQIFSFMTSATRVLSYKISDVSLHALRLMKNVLTY